MHITFITMSYDHVLKKKISPDAQWKGTYTSETYLIYTS